MGSPIFKFTIQIRTSGCVGWEGVEERTITWKEARLYREEKDAREKGDHATKFANMSQYQKVMAKIEKKLERERRRKLGLHEAGPQSQLEGVVAVSLHMF